jgi:hypothetical protein
MAQQISVLGADIAALVFHIVGMHDKGEIACRQWMALMRCCPARRRSLRPSWAWTPVAVPTTGPGGLLRRVIRCG